MKRYSHELRVFGTVRSSTLSWSRGMCCGWLLYSQSLHVRSGVHFDHRGDSELTCCTSKKKVEQEARDCSFLKTAQFQFERWFSLDENR
jgi:hypothetical protein